MGGPTGLADFQGDKKGRGRTRRKDTGPRLLNSRKKAPGPAVGFFCPMSLIDVAPVPGDPRSIPVMMAWNPRPVVGIRTRTRSRAIIIGGRRRRSIIRPAVGTKRGTHNSRRSADNARCNREREEKRITVIAVLGAHIRGGNSYAKGKPDARCDYDFFCIHFRLPMCHV
jgi:hypothetical protein